jgi:preprotein translocase subunit SecG
MLYYGILFFNCLICVFLIIVVLLQRSEGGALGGGGSPTGLVTTRGAGDLLTRTTWVLFAMFLTLSLSLTLLGGRERSSQSIIDRLKLQSVNPDTLAKRAQGLASGAAGSAAPGAATPPPVQAAAPKPSVRLPTSTSTSAPSGSAPAPSGGSLDFSTPAPVVSLPPIPTAPKPAKP